MNYDLIKAAEETWLFTLATFLDQSDELYIFESGQAKFNDQTPFDAQKDFFIISPQTSVNQVDYSDTILMTFPIVIATSQAPDDVLVAHRKNRDLQELLDGFLFGSERRDAGRSMDREVFALPLNRYNASGGVIDVLDGHEMNYERAQWNDQTPDGSTIRVWVMQVTATIF